MSKRNGLSKETKELYASLGRSLFLCFVALFAIATATVAWFVNNTRTNSEGVYLTTTGKQSIELATVGKKEQGVYDCKFPLRFDLPSETINGVTYYIASSNSSLRLDSDKNLNNFYASQDLRPGNKGSFDIYVICRSDAREFVLKPCLKAYEEKTENILSPIEKQKTDFLYGHILFFTGMDSKGMYSGAIDMSQNIKVNLSKQNELTGEITQEATQNFELSESGIRSFSWGEQIASEDGITVYRLSVYWVWPEQFGNFIYTGNAYNKNLFLSNSSNDYKYFVSMMEGNNTYSRYFDVVESETRPKISLITDKNTDFQIATQYYNFYSSWYNNADEWIGENVNYIELGFELADKTAEGE